MTKASPAVAALHSPSATVILDRLSGNTVIWEQSGAVGRITLNRPETLNAWIPEFLDFCDRKSVPVDFVSTHHYPTDALWMASGFLMDLTSSLSERKQLSPEVQAAGMSARGHSRRFWQIWSMSAYGVIS